jgi:hypothetical protein
MMKGLPSMPKMPGLGDAPSPSSISTGDTIAATFDLPGTAKPDPLEQYALQGVTGSLPERIIWKWLEDSGHNYIAQEALMGGRLILGGAVVDFIVYDLARAPVVLRVQGDYWHGPLGPGKAGRDDEQSRRLTERGYIVVDLWESDIYGAARGHRLEQYVRGEMMLVI